MTGVPTSVNATDTMASHFAKINRRLASLERASTGGGGGAINWPDGYPDYDPRYVNTAGGDAMAGQLRIEQASAGTAALRLKALAGSTQAYLEGVDSADQRIGYLNFLTAGLGLRLASDAGLIYLRAAAVDALVIASTYIASDVTCRFNQPANFWAPNSDYYGVGTVGGMTTNGSYRIGFYGNGYRNNAAGWTDAANNGAHGSAAIELDPTGVIILKAQATAPSAASGAAEVVRVVPQGLLIGKTGYNTYPTVAGTEIWGGAGQNFMTMDTASVNLWISHISTADQTGVGYVRFIRTGNTVIGSIVQSGTTAVVYNTTSHGPWKGDVRDVTDAEALDFLDLLRPRRFRWKFNDAGVLHENGTPTGDEQHGFIAQELADVAPHAATRGHGTQAEHDAWVVRQERYAAAVTAHEAAVELAIADDVEPPPPLELDDPGLDPFEPGQTDASKLVADLTAALQALKRIVLAQGEQITELRALLGA